MSGLRLARAPVLGPVLRWSAPTVALRAALLLSGGVAVVLAPGGRPSGLPGLLVLVGVLGLVAAVTVPDGAGPAVVLGGCGAAWAVRYGTGAPPLLPTLLLAAALAVHHQVAALAAVLPPTARVDRTVLRRFASHGGLVVALSAAVAVLALGVARPGRSVPLELAGLAAAVLVAAVPVLLALGGRPGRPPGAGPPGDPARPD